MSSAVTILNYLNEDCWGLVLSYVPVRDILRTEPTSRRWQAVVLRYLSNVRIGLELSGFQDTQSPALPSWILRYVRWVKVKAMNVFYSKYPASIESWLEKLGVSVVASDVCSKWSLDVIGKNCPNLEAVMFVGLHEEQMLNNPYEVFTRLRRLRFEMCDVSDSCVNQFISSEVLEEFEISDNTRVSGECLMNIKSKYLKSLVFTCCKAFASRLLLAAADRLSELTQLVLDHVNIVNIDCFDEEVESYEYLLPVLNKTPKLEHLFTRELGNYLEQSLFEPVYQLGCLRHLAIDSPATDMELEAVARCCPHLQSLKLEYCNGVTGRGLAALCRLAGARLTTLGLPGAGLTDLDVAGCVAACPNLKELDVCGCTLLTRGVLARAALARRALRARRPLRILAKGKELRANDTEDRGPIEEFEELELPYCK